MYYFIFLVTILTQKLLLSSQKIGVVSRIRNPWPDTYLGSGSRDQKKLRDLPDWITKNAIVPEKRREIVDLYWYLTLPQVGVNLLEDGNAEGGGLAGSRLRLGDHVHSLALKQLNLVLWILWIRNKTAFWIKDP